MKQKFLSIEGKNLNLQKINTLVSGGKEYQIKLNSSALKTAAFSHEFLEETIRKNHKIIYGINTGFGPMASYILAHDQILHLQQNLILSHAVGMGEKIKDEFVLAAMVVRLNTLIQGYSGVSPELLKHLQRLINLRIIPVVPEHGAVGTSGDLVQLAHIALALIGKGEASFENKIQPVADIFKRLKIMPYKLKPKEGLSLINGTSMMTGIGSLVCKHSNDLLSLALRNGALALEIVKAYDDSYSPKLHNLRPHKGQLKISQTLAKILRSSKLIRSREILTKHVNHGKKVHKISEHVQEIYSLRCLSQILGPIHDTLATATDVTETEMNSVTDNPIIDIKSKKFLHGGNFHGDYVAVAMDQLKMSLVKMTMLSERRLNFFLNDRINGSFPPFLNLDTPGLTLGLQGLQFVATSTTANSQTLAYPMNLHSISTNGDNQDVVSMGTDAALLANKVVENAYVVLTIESLALCQAVDYLKIKNKLSIESQNLFGFVRKHIKKVINDREIQAELQNLLAAVKAWNEINIF